MAYLKKIFGHIVSQPLPQTLRQYRVYTLVLLGWSAHIMNRLVNILETGEGVSDAQFYGAVGVLAAAVFATIWKGIESLSIQQKADD